MNFSFLTEQSTNFDWTWKLWGGMANSKFFGQIPLCFMSVKRSMFFKWIQIRLICCSHKLFTVQNLFKRGVAPRYKPKGRGLCSLCAYWVVSASNRNDYQGYVMGSKGGQCLRLPNLLHLCTYCLQILGVSPSWGPKQGLSKFVIGYLYRHSRQHSLLTTWVYTITIGTIFCIVLDQGTHHNFRNYVLYSLRSVNPP